MILAIICLICIIVGFVFENIGCDFFYDWLERVGDILVIFGIFGICWFIFANSEVISSLFKI